jgi:ribonuclease R
VHDEQQHALIGKRTGIVYRLGAKLTIKIVEADGFTGSSLFEVVGREGADLSGVKFRTTNNKGLQKKHSSNKDNATGKRDGRRAIGKHKPKKGGKRR